MADYMSTGLWNKEGANVEVENYNLAADTLLALSLWCAWYEKNDDYKDPVDRKVPAFDIKAFSEQGLVVAKMVKRDLPDFLIYYFDEYALGKFGRGDDRLRYEYPVEEARV